MVSVTSASRYHPRYQSRSSMYIRGLIPLNFAEMAEAVLIGMEVVQLKLRCFAIQLSDFIDTRAL